MRSKRVTLIGLLQAAAIVTLFFSVATSFNFADSTIQLFSHFRLQYLAGSLLLMLVFAILRSPVYAFLLFGASVLNASFVVPWYFGDVVVEGGTPIKILHANVHSTNDEYELLLKLVEDEQPDVISIQEYTPAWQKATQRLQQDYPFNYVETREGNFGIALYSRIALDSVTHIDSPPFNYPTIIATMTVNTKSLTMINTHPTIPISRSNYEARNEQLRSVTDIANGVQGALVLTGDFNDSLWGRHYRLLEESTGLRNTRRGIGIVPTWPTFMPFAMIPIEHALVSSEIGVIDTRTGSSIGSDHLPLIVELAVGQQFVKHSNSAAKTL